MPCERMFTVLFILEITYQVNIKKNQKGKL